MCKRLFDGFNLFFIFSVTEGPTESPIRFLVIPGGGDEGETEGGTEGGTIGGTTDADV